MKSESIEKLDWQAFQYLSGELSDGECDAFEQLLESDQRAREALARGVELTQAAWFALDDARRAELVVERRTAPVESTRLRRTGWVVAVTTLCASLLVGVIWLNGDRHLHDADPAAVASSVDPAAPVVSAELASLWIETRNDLAEQRAASSPDWLVDLEPAESVAEVIEARPEMEEIAMPSWMMAAVSVGREEGGNTSDLSTQFD